MTALIRGNGDAVRVFLQRAIDDLLDRPVVTKMDHLAARRLQGPAHDVDRRVVTGEEARRGHEADLVDWLVDERLMTDRGIVHLVRPRAADGQSRRPERKLTP